ncbi:lipid A biosynthesis lauroyl acyltransferase [Helicobacter heilmannii]|uniref:lipid A biosynthesis lauroyl acyltransferase n=1 Tax=Helicobacter heilmannii TaxID=35817 RepID=UPI0006A1FDD3|nr:lipid A biosynthesis lauroyl acyltransferase [Helicobacter heilmannii]CRF45406.1 Lipid A biosynthesis lauroyl acyltransferase [Helicobacter heilmannii]
MTKESGICREWGIFWGKVLEWALNGLGFVLACMPHSWFVDCVRALGFVFYKLDKRRYYDAKANLDFVFPEMEHARKEAIIKRAYQNFAFIILESVRVEFLPKDIYDARFTLIDQENVLKSLAKNGQAVVMGMHFGYWEAVGTSLAQHYAQYDRGSLGRLTKFESINRLIVKHREAFGVHFINKVGAFKELLKVYNGGKGLVGILVDQNISPKEGVEVDFFGHKATHTTIGSILARRFNIDIVAVIIDFNEDYSHYFVTYYPPIQAPNTEDSQADIQEATQAQATLSEQIIRAHPESWFWFHRRFKSTHPEIYKKPT